MRWSRRGGYGLSLGLIGASIACGDNASPTRSLLGDWELVSFTDHGVMGITTGTMTFTLDGTWEMIGTVTYPGEPIDSLRTGGTYIATAHTVALTTGADTATWDLSWGDGTATLTLQGPLPTNVILLAGPT